MNRPLNCILLLTAGILFASTLINQRCLAQEFMPEEFSASQFVEYERQLNAILKTRHDAERAFIGDLVTLVRLGRIPSRLLSTSYQWGIKNRPNTNYPFIYFERVLRIQATQIGLGNEIPGFDFAIYNSPGQRADGDNGSVGQRPRSSRNFFSRRPITR